MRDFYVVDKVFSASQPPFSQPPFSHSTSQQSFQTASCQTFVPSSSPGGFNNPVSTKDSPRTILVEPVIPSSAQITQTFEECYTDFLSHDITDTIDALLTNNQQLFVTSTTILGDAFPSSARIAQTFEECYTDFLSHDITDIVDDLLTNNQQLLVTSLENFSGVPDPGDGNPSQGHSSLPSPETHNTLDIDHLRFNPLLDIPGSDFIAGSPLPADYFPQSTSLAEISDMPEIVTQKNTPDSSHQGYTDSLLARSLESDNNLEGHTPNPLRDMPSTPDCLPSHTVSKKRSSRTSTPNPPKKPRRQHPRDGTGSRCKPGTACIRCKEQKKKCKRKYNDGPCNNCEKSGEYCMAYHSQVGVGEDG
ncbi:hypothetical protein BC937DRAFT_91728 [Endogone sp. FLAS-F59071]|nr:hypothetical protein BC937DRAFT_91728 [Endogone sp. FLAS-F59071]|eukprot:RUS15984.1 hypothetical protein BC937DRAFT_91728 [Endogone sp. FLAS-F59071]